MTYLLSLAVALITSVVALQQTTPEPRLNITQYYVSDTSKYESFRLKVLNNSDSLVVIEQIHPSCGCVLATVQRNIATRDNPGDIYVAVTSDRVSATQPIVIEVITNRNRETPLKLYINKRPKPEEKEG